MKVIDLLNKIANGEEVPRKFMVDGDTLYIGEDKFIEYADGEKIEWFIYPSWLNEEVEIIEENKKIEKIETYDIDGNIFIDDRFFKYIPIDEYHLTANEQVFVNKINKIIDKLEENE